MPVNPHLAAALKDLEQSGAVGLPSAPDVDAAEDGKEWVGQKKKGGPWSLVKNEEGSYTCVF